MSWFNDLKKGLQGIINQANGASKRESVVPKVDPKRQEIVELIKRFRDGRLKGSKERVVESLTDSDCYPRALVWQVIHSMTGRSWSGPDKSYIDDLAWRINDFGSGRHFVQQDHYFQENAYEILTGFSEQALGGVLEGLAHNPTGRGSSPRQRAAGLIPLLACLGLSLIPVVEPFKHSKFDGVAEEAVILLEVINKLWNSNGKIAAECYLAHGLYRVPASTKMLSRFDDEAMRHLVCSISSQRRGTNYHQNNPADDLCSRLLEVSEKSLPFIREASESDLSEISDEAITLLNKIEPKRANRRVLPG